MNVKFEGRTEPEREKAHLFTKTLFHKWSNLCQIQIQGNQTTFTTLPK